MRAASSLQAALDQVKAQAKVTQRALDEAQRNIAALQGILGAHGTAQARHNSMHTTLLHAEASAHGTQCFRLPAFLACFGLQPCSGTDSIIRHADKSFAILEASRRDRFRGHGGRKHSGDPGGLSIPRRRRPAAEAAKRMRWAAKMQVRTRA